MVRPPDPPSVITFRCPTCGGSLKAAAPLAGRVTPCPHCDRPLTVPEESAADPPSTDEIVIDPTVVTRHPPPRA